MADAPGMDMVLQGYSGLAHAGEQGPEPLTDPTIDYTAPLLMSFGIATALYQRQLSGRGQHLEVSLLQAALMLQNNHINHIDAIDGWRHEFVDYLKDAFARGDSWTDRTLAETSRRIAAQSTAHWMAVFDKAGVPAGRVQFKEQLIDELAAAAVLGLAESLHNGISRGVIHGEPPGAIQWLLL